MPSAGIFYKKSLLSFYGSGIFAFVVLGVVLAVTLSQPTSAANRTFSDLATLIIDFLVFTALLIAALQTERSSHQIAIAWGVLTLAMFFYVLGDVCWALVELYLKSSPVASVFSSIYIVYYPLFLTGFLLMPIISLTRIQRVNRLLEVSIVIVTAILFYWNYLFQPVTATLAQRSLIEIGRYLILPGMDLLLLSVVLVLMDHLTDQQSEVALIFLVSGTMLLTLSDGLFSYQTLTGTYTSGGILDLGWNAAHLCTGMAAVVQCLVAQGDPDFKDLHQRITRIGDKAHVVLPYFPYVWLIAAYLLLVNNYQIPMRMGFIPMAFCVGCIIMLAIARQIMDHMENRRLYSQVQGAMQQVQNQALELTKTNKKLQAEIVEHDRAEEQLAFDSLHHELTGLPNRILLTDRVGQAIEYTRQRPDYTFSLLSTDLDQFSLINDSLGRAIGDKLLIAIAKRLVDLLRPSDTIADLGGGQFVILLENIIGEDFVFLMVNLIRETLKPAIVVEGHEIYTTTSIGIVMNVLNYNNPEELLHDADTAMYRAKSQGKGCYEVFKPMLRAQAISRLELENDLRRALDNNEFQLYYQPITNLATGRINGFEALIRWLHPDRGLLSPAEFIPVAEESGLIIPIGSWVLLEACTQLKKWHDKFPGRQNVSVNVNISGKQFSQPGFTEYVEQVLIITGLKSASLKLEITESTLIEDYVGANEIIMRLTRQGIHLDIDDFGTGYSSLNYLQNFSFHTIKIDKSFVQNISEGGKSIEILRAMISMARDLGMSTIAEGVETVEQLNQLQGLKCDFVQGYLMSPPMDAVTAEGYLIKAVKTGRLPSLELEGSKVFTNLS